MRGFITYFIKYPVVGNVLLFLLIGFGIMSAFKMKSRFFPAIPSRNITVQVTYPGASPEEIEEGIILKIEDNLKGTTGIERITSTSNENAGSINIEIIKGNDIDVVLQEVKNAVDRISSFPTGMEPPVIFKFENLDSPFSLALTGSENLRTLKMEARKIERDLLGVEGISKVELSGFPEEEIVIELDQLKLRAHNITLNDVMTRVKAANLETTGGIIRGSSEELVIRARNKGYYAKEFENITVRAFADGRRLKLSDLAVIEDRWAESPVRNYFNGKPSITIDIKSTTEENFLFITDYIKSYKSEYNNKDSQYELHTIRDGSINLEARIQLLFENGIIGFILVLVLLTAFLNFRLAFWVAISIPISFAGMFIVAEAMGYTINVISLYGMIIVIGILVDDGIVISENIYQHYEAGKSRLKAAIDGSMEVLGAVLSAILTTIVAFMSFFYIDGRLGDFFRDMAFVVIATLVFSLVEGALILPAHIAHSKALGKGANKPNVFTRFMQWMRNKMYAPVLRFCIANKFLTVATAVAFYMLMQGAIGGGFVKTTFFPFIERNNVNIVLKMPAGTRESITKQWIDKIERAAWAVNKDLKSEREDGLDVIEAVDKQLGPGTHEAKLNITTLDMELRNMSVLALTEMIRQKAGPIPLAEEVQYGVSRSFGKPVSVAIKGDDLNQVRAVSDELKLALNELTEVKDVIDNDLTGGKEVNIVLKEKAYLLGLTTQQVMQYVRQGFFGAEVQRLQRGQDEVRVWVRLSEKDRSSLVKLSDLRIQTSNGTAYRLSEIADFEVVNGVLGINHTDGQREVRVEADVSNPDVSVTDLLANIRDNIMPPILGSYPGVRADFEGQNRERMKAQNSMVSVVIPILILMFAIVVVTFRSFLQTLVVVLIVPFGLIGVTLGHYIHDVQLSLFSILGIIALIGILINDSLVFISSFNNMLKEGKTVNEAIYETGLSRFRPIVLTSITTIAGLMPLLLEGSFQAQFLIPMAISVAYGLLVSTVMILLLLPVLLMIFNRLKIGVNWYWYDKTLSPELVEPAVQEMGGEDE